MSGAVFMRISPVPTAAAILVSVLTAALGFWQIRRAQEKEALQALQVQAGALDSLPLDEALDRWHATARLDRRVLVSGRFVADRTVFIDNRTHHGVAGAYVVTPLRLANSDRWVLVLRGWTATDPSHRDRPPVIATPSGDINVEGFAQTDLPATMMLGADPQPGAEQRLWQQFSRARFVQWADHPVTDLVIRQSSDAADGLIRDWPQAGSDVSRHHAYAFQWFAMSALTLLTWGFFTFRRKPPNTAPEASIH
jgi:cytochrome oxidase assembly protein ShyY1